MAMTVTINSHGHTVYIYKKKNIKKINNCNEMK